MLSEELLSTTWVISESMLIDAAPEDVYDLVSDITRTNEWSPECTGGEWATWPEAQVGSRFLGYNDDHGMRWTSESEVIKASRPAEFSFSVMRFRVGGPGEDSEFGESSQLGDMTWSFRIEPKGAGCVLTQTHSMHTISVFFRALLETVEDPGQHLAEREDQLARAMRSTLRNIKSIAEAAE
ncbi:SRPBCC family protein [Rhodococcus sp. LW-XY12]|uniref:SRPBCC family protein n=1 Tax=Rhodococcus sp. LW-XY12 TaxID=2856851 RepID=UPI001C562900|nr:SRPBCC family protein [Rhodococcus sp. LW-XY12]QXU56679.1 SRPBCC family protein [Rhodococcus sp. LW-XY12]